jgi:hypothetical protein
MSERTCEKHGYILEHDDTCDKCEIDSLKKQLSDCEEKLKTARHDAVENFVADCVEKWNSIHYMIIEKL